MKIEGTRFGEIEIDGSRIITFMRGLVGFPTAKRFVLLEPKAGMRVAWLQSLDTPVLAFPVIDGGRLGEDHALPDAGELAEQAGLEGTDLATLVVVAASPQGLSANLLAPVVVNLETLTGAQVVLDARRFDARAHVAGAGPQTPPRPRLAPSPAEQGL